MSTPTATLSNFWDTYKPHILGALGGAGLGAASLGGITAMSEEPDPEVRASNMRRNLALGAVLGGLGGGTSGAVYNHFNKPEVGTGFLSRAFKRLRDSGAAQGAALTTAGHAGYSGIQNRGFPLSAKAGVGKGGALGGKTVHDLQGTLQTLLKEQMVPDSVTKVAPITTPAGQTEIRGLIDRMTANQTVLGRASQNPLWRNLGISTAPGEGNVADALRLLQKGKFNTTSTASTIPGTPPQIPTTITGEEIIKQLLGKSTKPSVSAFPYIQKDVLGGGEPGAAIRGAKLRSLTGRAGLGALLYPLLGKLNEMSKPVY